MSGTFAGYDRLVVPFLRISEKWEPVFGLRYAKTRPKAVLSQTAFRY
ncbi:hypothetical protein PJE062_2501 [Pseudovibrio sp. JE062]|nr:hypothetical protein PJE062_2501 [Pseudovibrio sp. JE062]